MTKTIGFVGVGTMGEPMAANLLAAGHSICTVTHHSRTRVERLLQAGATEAATVAELAARVDVLISCVSDDSAVEEVMLGERGVLVGGKAGLIVVDTSTISPVTSRRVAQRLAALGVEYLDAPLSGGETGAKAGTLAIMVGGSARAFEQVLPILRAIGKTVTYIGDNGSALVVKLVNNLIAATTMVAISEGLIIAAESGIDPGTAQSVLAKATARSFMVEDKLPRTVLVGDLKPGFKLSLMHKDVGLALGYGKDLGVPMFVTSLIYQLYTQAIGMGKGDLDSFGICELYSDATGTDLRARTDV